MNTNINIIKHMKNVISLSAMIALLAATADAADTVWDYHTVGWGQNVANYASLAVTSQGYWAVAYDDTGAGLLKCASLVPSGQGYTIETVMNGGIGAAVAYSANGEISISHVYGRKLYFVTKIGSSWINKQVEGKDVYIP